MNNADLVEKKKDLFKVGEEFQNIPGYERQTKFQNKDQIASKNKFFIFCVLGTL